MGKLYLIRHAASNVPEGQLAGRSDVDARLPALGLRQGLAARLPHEAEVWCSPAKRCQQTAAALELTPQHLIQAFWEQDFGDWEGQTWQAIGQQPDYWADPINQAPPGGESFAELSQRVTTQLPKLRAALREGDLVVLLHAGPIRALVAACLGLSLERALGLGVDPFSLTVLQAFESDHENSRFSWNLERLNERSTAPVV